MSRDAANIIAWVSQDNFSGVIVDDDVLRFHVLMSDDPRATLAAVPQLLVNSPNRVIWDIEYAVRETHFGTGFNLMVQVERLRRLAMGPVEPEEPASKVGARKC